MVLPKEHDKSFEKLHMKETETQNPPIASLNKTETEKKIIIIGNIDSISVIISFL